MLHKDACNIINSQKAEIINLRNIINSQKAEIINLRNIQEKQADIIAEINAQKYEQAYVIDCLKAEIKNCKDRLDIAKKYICPECPADVCYNDIVDFWSCRWFRCISSLCRFWYKSAALYGYVHS